MTQQPNEAIPASDVVEDDTKEPFQLPVSASDTSDDVEANSSEEQCDTQCTTPGEKGGENSNSNAGHASEKSSAIVQDQPESTPEGPPDGGTAAWLTVVGGFCSMFVSFGWTNCEYLMLDFVVISQYTPAGSLR